MDWLESLNAWAASHLVLVVSVGVPLLTVFVTAFVSIVTTRANTKAQERQRILLHKLKLAEFQQAWINDMREDLALYTARTWDNELNEGVESAKERVMAQARILMRMNPSDPDYAFLQQSLRDPLARPQTDKKALYVVGQRILKREWERLKQDLNEVNFK
ncbi:MAG: hypothetical protein J6S68_07045 [Acinetobacter sp.]|nr:hypothetical protein [Acinetobacter sp.]